jgi:hypothetical protein
MQMRKWAVASATIVAAGTVALSAAPAFAAGPVAGSYSAVANGQGGWAGGPLLSNGSVGGGGAVSISMPSGQFIERVVGGNWSPDGHGGVNITLDLVGISKNAPPTDSFSVDIPATGRPIKVTVDGGTTLIRARLF